jgi:hypothetical protein
VKKLLRYLGEIVSENEFCKNISVPLLSRHQNVGQNRDVKIANRSFENASQFKYLGTTVTNQI